MRLSKAPAAQPTGNDDVELEPRAPGKGEFGDQGGAAQYPAATECSTGDRSNVLVDLLALARLGGAGLLSRILFLLQLFQLGNGDRVALICQLLEGFVGLGFGGRRIQRT